MLLTVFSIRIRIVFDLDASSILALAKISILALAIISKYYCTVYHLHGFPKPWDQNAV